MKFLKKKLKKLEEKASAYFQEILRLKKSPHEIALGFAIGVFIGILPTPGLNVLIGLGIIFIWKKLNKLALFGGVAVFNPLTVPPIAYVANQIGKLLVYPNSINDPLLDPTYSIIRDIFHTTLRVVTGSVIIGIIVAIPMYFVAKNIMKRIYDARGIAY